MLMGCVPIVWYNSLIIIAQTGKIIKFQDENKVSVSYFLPNSSFM